MRFHFIRRTAMLGLTASLLAGAPASAQTIRPLVSEYRAEARGKFEVVNETDRPLTVVIEPRGFSVAEDGEMQDEALPGGIHLRLSAMSLRLPARQSRFVFYEATADHAPEWFVLYATFTGYSPQEFSGLNIRLELPHIVYLLPRDHWKATDIRVESVELNQGTRKLIVTVENRGSHFGRIGGLEVRGATQRVEGQGFPLFPGRRRRMELPWVGEETPDSVLVKSQDFSFEQRIVPALK
jgi:hypothetical protein